MRAGAALTAGLALAACGSSAPRHEGVVQRACSARTSAVLRAGAPHAGAVTASAFTAPSGDRGCRYSAPGAVSVTVDIDTAPQAHYRLDRQVVEYGQNVIWSHQGSRTYPRYIAHLSMEADWLPVPRELLATDGVRIVYVMVGRWPRRTGAEAVAERVVRLYLRPASAVT